MSTARTMRTPHPEMSEAWWPLVDVAHSASRWYADHLASGWWDPGDLPRTRLRHASALVDELLASLPQAAVADGARVLELGCGPGASLQELMRRWSCELHAWDASVDARAAARVLAPAATIHDAAALPLPIAGGEIDVVWAPRCFARGGEDWSELLAEAHRVLRPGGLLAAVLAGPGVWAWEDRDDAWDEALTGLLQLGLDRPDEHGGPISFTSRWWLSEHWGRGFEAAGARPAGVAMVHPGQGFGLAVWRRTAGAPIPAGRFAALQPGDLREGRAIRRQLELAGAEARTATRQRAEALAAMSGRAGQLARPGAVDDDPRVREALGAVAALEAEARRLRAAAGARPAATARALRGRLRAARAGRS